MILNRIVSAIFGSSSDEDIMEDDEDDVEESSNTQTYVALCHVTFWPRNSNAIFEGKKLNFASS